MWMKQATRRHQPAGTNGIWTGLGSQQQPLTWDNGLAYFNTFRNGRVDNIPVGSSRRQGGSW